MTTETNFAYLAGLIDGDGSIGIMRHSSQTFAKSRRLYHPYIKVSGIDEKMIRWIQAKFSGTLSTNYPPTLREKGYQRQYSVRWEYRKAYALAKNLVPFLIEKQNRALLLVEWYESGATRIGGQGRWHSDTYLEKQRAIWERMKSLQSAKGAHRRKP